MFSFVAVTCRICHGRGHVVRAIGQRRARHIQRPLAIGDAQAVIRRVIGAVEVHRQAVALRQVHATADHQLVVTGDEVGRIRRVFCDAVDAHRFGGVVTVCADFGIHHIITLTRAAKRITRPVVSSYCSGNFVVLS